MHDLTSSSEQTICARLGNRAQPLYGGICGLLANVTAPMSALRNALCFRPRWTRSVLLVLTNGSLVSFTVVHFSGAGVPRKPEPVQIAFTPSK